MAVIRMWLAGKKTYLLAGLLLLIVLVLLLMGRLTPEAFMSVLLFAACAFPVTFRAALANHQQQMLEIATEVAETGAAVAAHNYAAARTAGMAAAKNASTLYPEIKDEAEAAGADQGAKA